jgi:FixJ family two-component response regulator
MKPTPHLIETCCLIADVHMPAMSGIELYRHLIEAGIAIPTILVTAHPNAADQARALNDGVVCYLRKPVDERQLMRCLRTALSLAVVSKPISRQSATNCAHTLRIAGPLSLRKSAMVL